MGGKANGTNGLSLSARAAGMLLFFGAPLVLSLGTAGKC